ncbi:TPA: hypothetical protein ACGZ9U_002116 [Elizabethkingia anophelis]
MNKTLLSTSLWGILTLSLLSSCRTEDVANTQKQVEDKRFAVFIPKSEEEKIDYVQGFAYLYQNYFKENSIKEKDQKLVAKDFGVVDFRIHSQLFIQEDGTKAMVFPLRKENSINGLIMAILENNDTSLRYTVLEESQKGYTEILQRFLAVDRENDRPIHIPSSGKFPPGSSPVALAPPIKTHGISINDNGNGDIDREGDGGSSGPVKEIREVTITVPKVPSPPVIPPPLPQDIKLPPVGPGGGCEMYENCPPYKGGGGGGNSSTSQPAGDINIDQLKNYPCAYEVATQLPNLGNDLANLLKDIFGNSSKINITFSAGELQSNRENFILEGNTNYTYNNVTHIFNATTTLNKNVLQTATQEYILRIMYHEVIHAYLGYEFSTLGQAKFEEKYPTVESYTISNSRKFTFKGDYQHPRYAPFIDKITDAIMSYSQKIDNTSFTRERAKALALSGLFEDLNNNVGISQIINDESASNPNSKGKKCN